MKNKIPAIIITISTIGLIFLLYKKLNKKFKIGKSKIEGNGVFATKDLRSNEFIGNAVVDIKKTSLGDIYTITDDLGIWLNHQSATKNNAKLVKEGNKYVLRTIRKVSKGEEITVDYDLNPSFLEKSKKHYK